MFFKAVEYSCPEIFQICPEFVLTRHTREVVVNGEKIHVNKQGLS